MCFIKYSSKKIPTIYGSSFLVPLMVFNINIRPVLPILILWLWLEPAILSKSVSGQQSTSNKYVTSIGFKPEPAMWSHDTSQHIPCLTGVSRPWCMLQSKASVDLLVGVWPSCCATSYSPWQEDEKMCERTNAHLRTRKAQRLGRFVWTHREPVC